MGIGRSTFYDTPDARARDLSIVAEIKTICDEFEAYGYRRVDAELRHRGIVVNAKKIRRIMREHALNPKQRRRFVAGQVAALGFRSVGPGDCPQSRGPLVRREQNIRRAVSRLARGSRSALRNSPTPSQALRP
jgi:hypothetical protein